MDSKIKRLVMAALFAAMSCATTMVIKIPSPTQGYVNLGDCFVLLSGWLLGPVYGSLAAGIGSALADLFSGYPIYVPGTFVIKALIALVAWSVLKLLKKYIKKPVIPEVISGVCGEIIMVMGYFGYSSLLLGKGLAAAASIPGNLFQGAVGIAAGVLIYEIIIKNKFLNSYFSLKKENVDNGKR